MRRLLLLFVPLVLLWAIQDLGNFTLAARHAHVFLGGLIVTFVAVAEDEPAGLFALIFAGLVYDAHTPVPFGTHAFLFAIARLALRRLRERLPHEDTVGRVAIALLCNLGIFGVLSFFELNGAPSPGSYWGRTLWDLVVSQGAVILIGPWFFALQESALAYARP